MRHYEVMIILDPDLEEKTIQPSLEAFLNVIRSDGGTVNNVDIWGRRRLAYEINKKSEGIYAVVNLTSSSADILEVDRQLRLSEAVMRTKVLRADEAVFSIKPVAVPEVSAEEAAAEAPAKKAPAKTTAAKAPAKKPAAKKAE